MGTRSHRLKGSASVFGFRTLAAAAGDLEQALTGGDRGRVANAIDLVVSKARRALG